MKKLDCNIAFDEESGDIVNTEFQLNTKLITAFNEFNINQQRLVLGTIWKYHNNETKDNNVEFKTDELEILMGCSNFDRFAAQRLEKLLNGSNTKSNKSVGIVGKSVSRKIGDDDTEIFVLFPDATISWQRKEFTITISDKLKQILESHAVEPSISLLLRQCFQFEKQIYPLQFYLYFKSLLDHSDTKHFESSPLKISLTPTEIRSISGADEKYEKASWLIKDIVKRSHQAFKNGIDIKNNGETYKQYSNIDFDYTVNKINHQIDSVSFTVWYRSDVNHLTGVVHPQNTSEPSEPVADSLQKKVTSTKVLINQNDSAYNERILIELGMNKSKAKKLIILATSYAKEHNTNLNSYIQKAIDYTENKGPVAQNVGYLAKAIEQNWIAKYLSEEIISPEDSVPVESKLPPIPIEQLKKLITKMSSFGDQHIALYQLSQCDSNKEYLIAVHERLKNNPKTSSLYNELAETFR